MNSLVLHNFLGIGLLNPPDIVSRVQDSLILHHIRSYHIILHHTISYYIVLFWFCSGSVLILPWPKGAGQKNHCQGLPARFSLSHELGGSRRCIAEVSWSLSCSPLLASFLRHSPLSRSLPPVPVQLALPVYPGRRHSLCLSGFAIWCCRVDLSRSPG